MGLNPPFFAFVQNIRPESGLREFAFFFFAKKGI
jgi:hypothetical protein